MPLAITDKCVRMASNEGDLILEPFLGSGSVTISAMKYNRRFIGFELSPEIFSVAQKRLVSEKHEAKKSKKKNLDHWIGKK